MGDGSGVDELRFEGMFDLTQLQDLTFQLEGDGLLNMRFENGGISDTNAQHIQIKNMNSETNLIERLTLANPDGDIATISLVSVYSQTTSERTRFELATGSDSFGRLASPV